MSVKLTTSRAEITKYAFDQLEKMKANVIRTLAYVGEQCVNEARTAKTFKDQTGNLNSSFGYAIIDNGEIVNITGFKLIKDGHEGKPNSMEYIRQIAARSEGGLVLVVVAGMNYASYVADKGYNVLDSAELLAERLIPQLIK